MNACQNYFFQRKQDNLTCIRTTTTKTLHKLISKEERGQNQQCYKWELQLEKPSSFLELFCCSLQKHLSASIGPSKGSQYQNNHRQIVDGKHKFFKIARHWHFKMAFGIITFLRYTARATFNCQQDGFPFNQFVNRMATSE